MRLTVLDASARPINEGLSFSSGSPEIARVDPQTGVVTGMSRGFATITVKRGNESVSSFVVVTRVQGGSGLRVPGATEKDMGGRIYISNPQGHTILRKDSLSMPAIRFAGQSDRQGRDNGPRDQALFAGPTAVAVDNTAQGGIYIADTLNHMIRKINFDDSVETVLGNGAPGVNNSEITDFAQAQFRGLRGVAVDNGGNLFIADTENHAIYIADFKNRRVRLLAGDPGRSGKADGRGRAALFNQPVSIAVRNDGVAIAVADTGNRRVRVIDRSGNVTTVGPLGSRTAAQKIGALADGDEFDFNAPRSVSFDNLGNIYVVDNNGAQIITLSPAGNQIFALAQPGSIAQAVSLVVRGNESFVLDASSASEADAVKVVTVGEPRIQSLSRNEDILDGGAQVTITGSNFAPESQVLLGDNPVADAIVESATVIRFTVPRQQAPGVRTITVRTRGGVAQMPFFIAARRLAELENGQVTTVAGGVPFIGDGFVATNASFSMPVDVAIDGAGNFFVIDANNNRVRRIDTSGVITTVAGNGRIGFSGDGGPAINATLSLKENGSGLALDAEGNLFIVDPNNLRVRRVDARSGIITTVAGNGTTDMIDNVPATESGLIPADVAIDAAGNLFITDISNHRIRRVDALSGLITTIAGSGPPFEGGFGGDGGKATEARLNAPQGIVVDDRGNVIFADRNNHRVRRIDATDQTITTIAGTGVDGFNADNLPATAAQLNFPFALALDSLGNIYISDMENLRVRRVNASNGVITTVAGNGNFDFAGDGGPATAASFVKPAGLVLDGAGNLFIATNENNRVRRVDASTQVITTFAGIGSPFVGDNGPAARAGFNTPRSVNFDRDGNLYIADQLNFRARRVDRAGIITTVAGTGQFGGDGDGGSAVAAGLSSVIGVAAGGNRLFIADRDNHRIRVVDLTNGTINTIAGNGEQGFSGDSGPALSARLDSPIRVAVDSQGNLFIVDNNNHRIRRVDTRTGIISTVAGSGTFGCFDCGGFSGDGGAAVAARLQRPADIAIDTDGNMFILDAGNNRVRRVDARTGIITTYAGGGRDDSDNIAATDAGLETIAGLALDSAGNLFINEMGFNKINRVRRVDAGTRIITTVASNGGIGYDGDNGSALQASFANAEGLAIDSNGNLFIADTGNNVIRAIKGIAAASRRVTINDARFNKPNLNITGSSFGNAGAQVFVNDSEVTSRINAQTDTSINLRGNKKKLNLKNGMNRVVVIAQGASSNVFVFNLLVD